MAKILLVEPHTILQQAISLSLFPEHEVQVEQSLTGSAIGSLKDYDLLIVDGSALREVNQLTPEATHAIQGCKTPVLWLEENESSQPPKREKLVIVRKPIEREAFRSALAGFFVSPSATKERKSLLTEKKPTGQTSKATAKKGRAENVQLDLIDLVDIVEEEPSPRQGRKAPRKSK